MTLSFAQLFNQRDVRETSGVAATPNIVDFTDAQHTHADAAGGGLTSTVRSAIAGAGIDVSGATGDVTISGEDASTSNKGIAQFNSNDFSASSGVISLLNKTSYWSCGGDSFISGNPDTDAITYGGDSGAVDMQANTIYMHAPVNLPQGAVVTAVECFGDAASEDESWELERVTLAMDEWVTVASGNFNSEDTTITNATIDNSLYFYHFITTSMDTGDSIHGARITYTTDYN